MAPAMTIHRKSRLWSATASCRFASCYCHHRHRHRSGAALKCVSLQVYFTDVAPPPPTLHFRSADAEKGSSADDRFATADDGNNSGVGSAVDTPETAPAPALGADSDTNVDVGTATALDSSDSNGSDVVGPAGSAGSVERVSLGHELSDSTTSLWKSQMSPRVLQARYRRRRGVRLAVGGASTACCRGLVRQFAHARLPHEGNGEVSSEQGTSTWSAAASAAGSAAAAAAAHALSAAWWAELVGGDFGGNSANAGETIDDGSNGGNTLLRSRSENRVDATTWQEGGESCTREVLVHNQLITVRLEVWRSDRASCGAPHDGAIVVYDVTSRGSFHQAAKWARLLRGGGNPGAVGPLLALAGTHADIAAEVATVAQSPVTAAAAAKTAAAQSVTAEAVDGWPASDFNSLSGWSDGSGDEGFDTAEEMDEDDEGDNAYLSPLTSPQRPQSRLRVVSLLEGEDLASQLGARAHFELPELAALSLAAAQPARPTVTAACGHPVTQVVYALLSDLLLGSSWQPELLAAQQRLAWAAAVIPHVALPPRLPLTVILRVSSLLGRCSSRQVLARAKQSQALRWHRQGMFERALEAYGQVRVAIGPDEAVDSAMRRAEAARWHQTHQEATGGAISPPLADKSGGFERGGAVDPAGGSGGGGGETGMGRSDGSERWELWVDDSYSAACVRCSVAFSFIRRRHHCRYCGHLFCSECSDKLARGLWRRDGKRKLSESRVCRGCWTALRAAEARFAKRESQAAMQHRIESQIRQRAALAAAREFFPTAESPADAWDEISALLICQYLQAHADDVFRRKYQLVGNVRAVAQAASKEEWIQVFLNFTALCKQ